VINSQNNLDRYSSIRVQFNFMHHHAFLQGSLKVTKNTSNTIQTMALYRATFFDPHAVTIS